MCPFIISHLLSIQRPFFPCRWIIQMIEMCSRLLNAREAFVSGIICSGHTQSFSLSQRGISYRFAHILKTMRALQSSTKTSLRMDEEGLLGLQFLMPSPRPRGVAHSATDGFIEYRVRFFSSLMFKISSDPTISFLRSTIRPTLLPILLMYFEEASFSCKYVFRRRWNVV